MSTPLFLDRPFGDNLFINPLYELDEKLGNLSCQNATLEAQREGYRAEFANLLKQLSQPAHIVVAGSFNAGKSSFINALLGGQEVMPVLAVRCTASVNCLIKGEKRQLIVQRPNGQADRFDYADDADLVAQVRILMKQERDRIERIDIARPDLYFLDKFTLVDTPGLDFNQQDTAASNACIQRADAMIWVLHPEGLRKDDLQRIREFHGANPESPLIVVINRIDKLDAEEISTVVEEVKTGLRDTPAQVFPLSAYLACQGLQEQDLLKLKESRFRELNHYLHNHLFTAYRDLQNQRLSQKWSGQAQVLAGDMEKFLIQRSMNEPDTAKTTPVSDSSSQSVESESWITPEVGIEVGLKVITAGLVGLAFVSPVAAGVVVSSIVAGGALLYKSIFYESKLEKEAEKALAEHALLLDQEQSLLNAGRYEKTADGTEVIDHQTGLIWRADIERERMVKKGFFFKETRVIKTDRFTYEEALAHAGEVARQTGLPWRVPTVDELKTLIDDTRQNPASRFPDMPSIRFWSSSPYVGDSSLAWNVYFYYGVVDYDFRYFTFAVRLVRGG